MSTISRPRLKGQAFTDTWQVEIVDLTGIYVRKAGMKSAAILDGAEPCRVEEFAARHFRRSGFEATFLESEPFRVLFGVYLREIAAMLKAIHAGEDIVAAREKAIRVIEKLHALRLTRAAELVEAAVEETLAYYAFPEEHWRRIRTNNPLERILREIRRRTRVVGAFPDGQSALNLAAARLRHIAGTAWSTKRYLNIELLKDQQMRGAITA